MGIYYGDIHYGIKISKKILINGDTFLEPIYEQIFDDNSILLNYYLDKVKNIYLNLLEPDKYQYELFVDIFTTYNEFKINKGWQFITLEEMINFINGTYKIDFLNMNINKK
jgi:hypothetical protein